MKPGHIYWSEWPDDPLGSDPVTQKCPKIDPHCIWKQAIAIACSS